MSITRFKEIASALLQKHYGIDLNDTDLWDDKIVAQCLEQGLRPYQAIAEHADDTDLDRIDKSDYGVPSKVALTAADEDAVIQHLPIPGIQLADKSNDYVKASSLYEAYPGRTGSNYAPSYADMRDRFKPTPRAETWFRRMLEKGQGYLTEEEQAIVLNERYADSIIGDRHPEYDALEIHGVRDLHLPGDPNGSCWEVDNENPLLFSVYAHLKQGGIECVGDFATPALADAYAQELATKSGWPIHNYIPSRFK